MHVSAYFYKKNVVVDINQITKEIVHIYNAGEKCRRTQGEGDTFLNIILCTLWTFVSLLVFYKFKNKN